ncbi:MAG: hypothetical protein ABI579_03315 [Candidatus Sumerlaeota bacterium]
MDVQAFCLQLKPLIKSYAKYVRAHIELSAFVTQEKARLTAARFFLWTCSVIMVFACWIFFSMFLWRAAISLTNEPASGPLMLVLSHGAVAYALWIAQKRLKL